MSQRSSGSGGAAGLEPGDERWRCAGTGDTAVAQLARLIGAPAQDRADLERAGVFRARGDLLDAAERGDPERILLGNRVAGRPQLVSIVQAPAGHGDAGVLDGAGVALAACRPHDWLRDGLALWLRRVDARVVDLEGAVAAPARQRAVADAAGVVRASSHDRGAGALHDGRRRRSTQGAGAVLAGAVVAPAPQLRARRVAGASVV